jgi:hypothetical protein|tara:strand:- start:495 stop:1256 length:762 start_codon:yes stop_codon:yes gene_type:complete
MAYPILKPSSRSYDPGSYPVKTFKAQNGAETRILYGSERTDVKLSLSYANIGDPNAELFLDHYDEVQGTFQTFNLPGQALGGWEGNKDALKPTDSQIPTVTYNVTVVADGNQNYFRFSNDNYTANAQTLELTEGTIYLFSQQNASNAGHPLRFSTTSNGTHNSGTEYTTGVTTFGTPGQAGSYTRIQVATGAPTLYYYCSQHSGMGGQANTPAATTTASTSGSQAQYRYEGPPQVVQVRPGISTVTVNLIGVI